MTSVPYDVLLNTLAPGSTRESTLPELDRKPDPWESSMQATCECLSWRGAFDNLERRHAEDALGETIYHDFPVRARSAVITAHTLMDRGVISPEELRARMELVRERFHRE
ncbi:SH3-like domain-containing protein [Nocardia bhagyanarayanae]|uniref:Nitrile hydratase beta subunit n=1 Tax=Nocardia bhagyanarayanae TaxID=1215925 RepID=A0A543F9K7_9NOCA|nr:SH3-like domain-containing protein [Nocardia bhagyanarayanae]TQM30503.1 nitrile hydratase beta subunit [Nocardia bhagyanarayanae]